MRTPPFVLAATAGALALLTVSSRSTPPPNVVLLSIDTLARPALRAFAPEAPERPALDAFARRAIVFAGAVTTASWTLPAQASLLTGLYPDRHGASDPRRSLEPPRPTLAEGLRRAGYHTLALTDGGFVDRRFGFAKGFERYDDEGEGPWPRSGLPRDGRPARRSRKALFDRALAFLDTARDEDAPFFLFLQTYAVHDYYLGQVGGRTNYRACLQGRLACAGGDWERLEERYREEVAHLDEAFGRLQAAVARLDRPTILIVVSDHGEGFEPERGRIHHGGRLHEDLVRVPLLVAVPGLPPRVVPDPVSLVDVAPTLLDLLGAPVPEGLDGRSFAAALRGGGLGPRPLLAMEHYYTWGPEGRTPAPALRETASALAVIEGERWYITGTEGEEIYDMRKDPRQRTSLPPGEFLAPLRKLAGLRGRLAAPGVATDLESLDQALREQLQSLGYIE